MGELRGTQIQARDIASECYAAGWTDALNLVTMVAVILSESQGYDRAVNDNLDEAGNVKSRDCGIAQINIPASKVGTAEEERLYDWHYNIARARMLYETATNNTGGIRGFQPWAAFNAEVYLRDTYIKRAARGVGNFLGEELLARTPTDTLNDGQPYVHSLTSPILDYQYRLVGTLAALTTVIARARQLKPIGGPLVDAKADEIITAAVAGQVWKTK